jgi:hypothetical protein
MKPRGRVIAACNAATAPTKSSREPYVPGKVDRAQPARSLDHPPLTRATRRRNVRSEERRPRESRIRLYVLAVLDDWGEDTGCTRKGVRTRWFVQCRKNDAKFQGTTI